MYNQKFGGLWNSIKCWQLNCNYCLNLYVLQFIQDFAMYLKKVNKH